MVAVMDIAPKVEVRRLQAKDVFTLAKLVHKCRAEVEAIYRRQRKPATLHKLGEDPAEPVEEPTSSNEDLGIAIIFALLGQAETEIKPWLADMCGLKPKEFEALGLTETMAAIEGIVRQEDWPAFLGRLTSMFTGAAT